MEAKDIEIINELYKYSGMTWKELAIKIGVLAQTFTDIRAGRHGISRNLAGKITKAFPEINPVWITTGDGLMLRPQEKCGIPIFEDVRSMKSEGARQYINVGTCFPGAELAMRNATDSMEEYPNGCILMLKRVRDIDLLIPGNNYVVETREFALPRKIQKGAGSNQITLCATSQRRTPDGKLVYEPFDIPIDSVTRMFAIIGYIYTQSAEMIPTAQ